MPSPEHEPGVPGEPPRYIGTGDAVFSVALHEPASRPARVPEALVQDLWQNRRFDARSLTTVGGQALRIRHPGTLNTDSGPDFTEARLEAEGLSWVGDVEVHTSSGTWFTHRHHLDPRYNSTVLHVSLYADLWTGGLHRADGTPLPELILYPYLNAPLRALLHQFYTRPQGDLVCAATWPGVPAGVREPWIEHLAYERLRVKARRLSEQYLHTPSLEALLHERLFAGLGYAKNTSPMAALACRLPLAVCRLLEDPLDLEALHFGTAGLLPVPRDLLRSDRATADYAMDLADRFERLRHRFDVPMMVRATWKFFRLRPVNFPTLRIAQGVGWLHGDGLLAHDPIGRIGAAFRMENPVPALRSLLHIRPLPFWDNHVRLVRSVRPRNPALGRQRIDDLIVNAVLPVMLLHAEQTGEPALEAAVLAVPARLPAPEDEVLRRFAALGTSARNALAAQGLHQLYRTRCTEARCLSCPIGQYMLGQHET